MTSNHTNCLKLNVAKMLNKTLDYSILNASHYRCKLSVQMKPTSTS